MEPVTGFSVVYCSLYGRAQEVSAKAGEIARETAVYRCEECDERIPVRNGRPIDDCPNCGCPSFFTGLVGQPQPTPVVFNGIA
jgi:ribosomal protein L37AE/L43A